MRIEKTENIDITLTNKGALLVYGGSRIGADVIINGDTETQSTSTGALIIKGGIGIQKGINMGTDDTSITTGTIQINGGGGLLLNTFGETGTLLNCHEKGSGNIALSGGGTASDIAVNYVKMGYRTLTDDTFKIIHFGSVSVNIGITDSTITGNVPTGMSPINEIQQTMIYDDGSTTSMGVIKINGGNIVIGSNLDIGNFTGGATINIRPFSITYN